MTEPTAPSDDFPGNSGGFSRPGEAGAPRPWEQRAGPGMGGGGGQPNVAGQDVTPAAFNEKLSQFTEPLYDPGELAQTINHQTELLHYPLVGRHHTPDTDLAVRLEDNAQAWRQFLAERLFDTRRVTLEHFHLFEWFPLAPGRFHLPDAGELRRNAERFIVRAADGRSYYNPAGKLSMVHGGVGTVRLRPRQVSGEPHYFMTASSTGVCHEGFPVLVPRRFYGPLKARMLAEGAVPVTLSGEMRYLDGDLPALFTNQRELPGLYLHVDMVQALPAPRPNVTRYMVSVAVSFMGTFQQQKGSYLTYCSFDPASAEDQERAMRWIEQFYVADQHQGVIITDFDEMKPRFPGAVFALPEMMQGQLERTKVEQVLKASGLVAREGDKFFVFLENHYHGSAFLAPISTGGGDFVAGDQHKIG